MIGTEITKQASKCISVPLIEDLSSLYYQSALFTSSELPLPIALHQTEAFISTHSLSSATENVPPVPSEVAKVLLNIYLEKILPQYPIFFESDVRSHFQHVYPSSTTSEPPADESVFIVAIIMAISTLTSKAKDFNKIASLGESLHRTALSRCNFLRLPSIRTVQCILLLVQLAMLLPLTGNLWHLVREAMSLAIQLGLHQESPSNQIMNSVSTDLRRRVFWAVGLPFIAATTHVIFANNSQGLRHGKIHSC